MFHLLAVERLEAKFVYSISVGQAPPVLMTFIANYICLNPLLFESTCCVKAATGVRKGDEQMMM